MLPATVLLSRRTTRVPGPATVVAAGRRDEPTRLAAERPGDTGGESISACVTARTTPAPRRVIP
ncbi:hypothetical protein GCM10017691_50700 [Pseudonocardia petroleophila]